MASLLKPYGSILEAFARLPEPTLITDRPWDALLILDACRLDLFRSVYPMADGIVSPGSTTLSWTRANLVRNPASGALRDTVNVTANPWTSKEHFRSQGWHYPFAEGINVFDEEWDSTHDTVLPASVEDAALDALKLGYPRILVHFVQPHAPFIGGEPLVTPDDFEGDAAHNVTWRRIRNGRIPRWRALAAYRENLDLVLRHALRLATKLAGSVVLTSDHGNLFGEYGLYGHPDIRVPELAWVPWLRLNNGESQ
ncbi:MAG: hypothetical protein ACE5I4_02090 [Thermoplasmata archaeon]